MAHIPIVAAVLFGALALAGANNKLECISLYVLLAFTINQVNPLYRIQERFSSWIRGRHNSDGCKRCPEPDTKSL